MTKRLLTRLGLLAGVAGPVLVFQQGCLLGDPDLRLQVMLQILSEVSVFALDNLLMGLR